MKISFEEQICIDGGISDEDMIDRLVFQMTYLGPFPCPRDGRGQWDGVKGMERDQSDGRTHS